MNRFLSTSTFIFLFVFCVQCSFLNSIIDDAQDTIGELINCTFADVLSQLQEASSNVDSCSRDSLDSVDLSALLDEGVGLGTLVRSEIASFASLLELEQVTVDDLLALEEVTLTDLVMANISSIVLLEADGVDIMLLEEAGADVAALLIDEEEEEEEEEEEIPLAFMISSSADDDGFEPGSNIPNEFREKLARMPATAAHVQCDGNNNFPKLVFSNIPSDAVSLVLIVDDSDANNWVHLNAWYNLSDTDILPNMIERLLAETPLTAASIGPIFPMGWEIGGNSWMNVRWGGPCPPANTGIHRYYFKVYALDIVVDGFGIQNLDRETFESSVTYGNHILASHEIFGTASFTDDR